MSTKYNPYEFLSGLLDNHQVRLMLDERDRRRTEAGVPETPPIFAVAKSSKWHAYQERKRRQAVN